MFGALIGQLSGTTAAGGGGGATWTQVGTTQGNGVFDGDPQVANKPTGVAAGDFLLGMIEGGGATLPSGFTDLFTETSGDGGFQRWFYKIAGGSEPSSYTYLNGVTSHAVTRLSAFRSSTGLDATPFETPVHAPYSGSATPSTAGATANKANSLWITIFMQEDTPNRGITADPAGFTVVDNTIVTSGSFNSSKTATYMKQLSSTGATGSASITWAGNEWGFTASLILRPA